MAAPFRPMRYGVGYEPASRAGWMLVGLFVLLITLPAFRLGGGPWAVPAYLAYGLVLAGGFFLLARRLARDEEHSA